MYQTVYTTFGRFWGGKKKNDTMNDLTQKLRNLQHYLKISFNLLKPLLFSKGTLYKTLCNFSSDCLNRKKSQVAPCTYQKNSPFLHTTNLPWPSMRSRAHWLTVIIVPLSNPDFVKVLAKKILNASPQRTTKIYHTVLQIISEANLQAIPDLL